MYISLLNATRSVTPSQKFEGRDPPWPQQTEASLLLYTRAQQQSTVYNIDNIDKKKEQTEDVIPMRLYTNQQQHNNGTPLEYKRACDKKGGELTLR